MGMNTINSKSIVQMLMGRKKYMNINTQSPIILMSMVTCTDIRSRKCLKRPLLYFLKDEIKNMIIKLVQNSDINQAFSII